MNRLLIAGANGFIARYLSSYFSDLGWEIAGLARRADGLHEKCRYVHWDGKTLGSWVGEMNQCDVLINMVGRSINCRHTKKNKDQILRSRVESTHILGEAISASNHPPALWINGSAAGFYAETFDHPHSETGTRGEGFIADVVEKWEEAFFTANIMSETRRVALRTTMVLANEPGNPLRYLQALAKLGLGGKAGSGKQMVSWIHIEDIVRAIEFIIANQHIAGPVNLAAPEALSNAAMMRLFRKHVGMPIGIPAPAFGVRMGAAIIGTAPELILNSCWVTPELLMKHHFVFKHPEIDLQNW